MLSTNAIILINLAAGIFVVAVVLGVLIKTAFDKAVDYIFK